ncbi:MAG: helical backbone metal receptor [Gammaproteobacteria bacterium]|nr:helical backbone metal receptor [Gammaproteobacteria bacterium]
MGDGADFPASRRASWRTLLIALIALSHSAWGGTTVTDDTGETVTLRDAARRIVTLAPHAAELVYAAGAGDALVATVAHSDEPPAAKQLPRIGDATGIDREALVGHRPDLVVAWGSAAPPRLLGWLRARGVAVYVSEPRSLDDVARSITALARLAGTTPAAIPSVTERVPQHRPPVQALFLFWDRPPIAAGGSHVLTDLVRSCGAEPLFADVPGKAIALSAESLLAADPDVVFRTEGRVQRRTAGGGLSEVALTDDERRRLAASERPGPGLFAARKVVCLQVARVAGERSKP